jgi:hypothetical protein
MTFTFKLERLDGTLAEPPSIRSAVTNWRPHGAAAGPPQSPAACRVPRAGGFYPLEREHTVGSRCGSRNIDTIPLGAN